MRFRSRKEGSALHWKPKNDKCVVTKDAKPNDKQYVFDRVFNEQENNQIVYQGKSHILFYFGKLPVKPIFTAAF